MKCCPFLIKFLSISVYRSTKSLLTHTNSKRRGWSCRKPNKLIYVCFALFCHRRNIWKFWCGIGLFGKPLKYPNSIVTFLGFELWWIALSTQTCCEFIWFLMLVLFVRGNFFLVLERCKNYFTENQKCGVHIHSEQSGPDQMLWACIENS